ncbi:NAD(P)-binding domain-containing protein [Micromonospora sp. NPDC023814]|uniref:NAD(P)-binding domain-containing protein n=1 Tax=Micromonospora sp. NPDC023814 TaxID=3154596 RepID=UPI0033FEC689
MQRSGRPGPRRGGRSSSRSGGRGLAAAGARVVDVPVTGGVARARTGELTLFASGAAADVDATRMVLDRFGTVRPVGAAVGDGQAIKPDADTPLLDITLARYQQAADAGLATRDDSRVIETYPPLTDPIGNSKEQDNEFCYRRGHTPGQRRAKMLCLPARNS